MSAELSHKERAALETMRRRREAIAASEANLITHALVEAARELVERITVYLGTVTDETAAGIFEGAGIEDEGHHYSGNVFSSARELAEKALHPLGEFVSFAACELPAPVAAALVAREAA